MYQTISLDICRIEPHVRIRHAGFTRPNLIVRSTVQWQRDNTRYLRWSVTLQVRMTSKLESYKPPFEPSVHSSRQVRKHTILGIPRICSDKGAGIQMVVVEIQNHSFRSRQIFDNDIAGHRATSEIHLHFSKRQAFVGIVICVVAGDFSAVPTVEVHSIRSGFALCKQVAGRELEEAGDAGLTRKGFSGEKIIQERHLNVARIFQLAGDSATQ